MAYKTVPAAIKIIDLKPPTGHGLLDAVVSPIHTPTWPFNGNLPPVSPTAVGYEDKNFAIRRGR